MSCTPTEPVERHDDTSILQDFINNNLELAELMENFMIKTNFVRISGPYREVEFGGSNFGHASKLLENRHFVYEYFKDMTKKQKDFIDKVIDVYNLSDDEIQEVKHA